MPKYVNRFRSPEYIEEVIVDSNDNVLGTIRLKPSGVSWKPKNAQDYYTVSLSDFATWITGPNSEATKRKR